MKREKIYNRLAEVATLIVVSIVTLSCAPSLYPKASYDSDDMYATHNQESIGRREAVELYSQERVEQQRMAQWAQILGIEVDKLARYDESYDTPYGERLRALSSDSYELPASYYQYEYQDALEELAQYDPELYNASIDYNGELSIEPKYMSSIYGAWENPYYDTYSWFYGYPTYGYPAYGYYSMWGYPYASYGFGVGFGYSYNYYNPWWGGLPGYGFGYGYPYYGWYSPFYAPIYHPGGGGRGGSRSIVKQANPYQSPSSGGSGTRRSSGSTVGRSSGNSYNRSATTYKAPSSVSTPSRAPSGSSGGSSTPTIRRNSIGR